ncbi:hypothetical protein F5141DRAFT_1111637 [Pisolithus sp. B1]|nr:hypothetical protein F5141DRAFT_1111637 [Pisolithus sp. B1]
MLHSRGHRLLMDLEHLWKSMDKLTPKNESAVAVGSRAHLVQTEAVVKVCLCTCFRSSSIRSLRCPQNSGRYCVTFSCMVYTLYQG